MVLTLTTGLIGFIPNRRVKRWFASLAYLASMRILMRSLSVVITFHNEEYRPKTCGICVANHTSTIDVGILSTQNVFSLVSFLGDFHWDCHSSLGPS